MPKIYIKIWIIKYYYFIDYSSTNLDFIPNPNIIHLSNLNITLFIFKLFQIMYHLYPTLLYL